MKNYWHIVALLLAPLALLANLLWAFIWWNRDLINTALLNWITGV